MQKRTVEKDEVFTGFLIPANLHQALKSRALVAGLTLRSLWIKMAEDYVKSVPTEVVVEGLTKINPIERLTRYHDQRAEEAAPRKRTRTR